MNHREQEDHFNRSNVAFIPRYAFENSLSPGGLEGLIISLNVVANRQNIFARRGT